jgi:hypothetical protein
MLTVGAPLRLARAVAAASQRLKSLRHTIRDAGRGKVTCPRRAKKRTLWQAVNNIVTEGTFRDAASDATVKKNFTRMTSRHTATPQV